MPTEVRWADVEAECVGYREGFVAVFKRYEGQPTDERDERGRVVKVTAASFARHMGIAKQTFHAWVAGPNRGLQPQDDHRLRKVKARQALQDPEAVVEAVMELPEEHAEKLVEKLDETVGERRRASKGMRRQPKERYEAQTAVGAPYGALQHLHGADVELTKALKELQRSGSLPWDTREEFEETLDIVAEKLAALVTCHQTAVAFQDIVEGG